METVNKKPKKKPTKIEEMTKEQIRQAILKKRECNAKAQQIVENLLERGISEAYFMQCLPDINQSHFEDIIEERAITHLCGYPICSKTISETEIPKQKYRISMKTNKVYDITVRKNFCSNSCYKSAMYVQKQMLTSPLWFREYEDIPNIQLLPSDAVGSLGQEVDVALVEKVEFPKAKFVTINDFAGASLNEMTGTCNEEEGNDVASKPQSDVGKTSSSDEKSTAEENKGNVTVKSDDIEFNVVKNELEKENKTSNTENILESCEQITEVSKEKAVSTISQKKGVNARSKGVINQMKTPPNPFNIVGDIVEKPERKIDPILTDTLQSMSHATEKQVNSAKKVFHKKQPSLAIITIEVEKCLAEWFTLDTLLFLFGEEKVKEMVTDKGECIKQYMNNYAKSIFYTSNSYDQYQALCRKLNMLELEDRKYDAQTLQKETKPLPDYSMIQEESKKMQLKVKAFFAGETVVPETNTNVEESSVDVEGKSTQLPLVDKNAQNALRRRIVCQHLNKVLPDLIRSLGLLTLSISSDVRIIVNTFKLKANNIMFKPIQWTLIAIVIIKLLSLRDKRLEFLLQSPTAYEHMQLLLLSYKQDGGYLDRLISWLTDIDRLLDTNDIQLTIE